jgi:hypothetical protein
MSARNYILWFGDDPTEDDYREAKNRGLTLDPVDASADIKFASSRAAIFWARSPAKFAWTIEVLEEHILQAIDYGLLIFVVVAEVGQFNEVNRVIAKMVPEGLRERCVVRTMRDAEIAAHEGPNKAAVHDPGPAPRMDLQINPPDLALDEDDILLLRRAFHDCKSISLQIIAGGLSGAKTVIVEAVLLASNAGTSPMPYFAKLHSSGRLIGEMNAFREYAEHHIAWHLRPNFQGERCIYGVRRGILVGNFVQGSESLWVVAREGGGPALIRSLFEETLAMLRKEHLGEVNNNSIASALQAFCRHEKIPQSRVDAAMSIGQVRPSTSLWRNLLGTCPAWRRSALHGDMHGENVRVRKTDAIVIDFAHATTGPTSTDLASLEVWLAFKSVPGEHSDENAWRKEVDSLYAPEALDALFTATEFKCAHRPWLSDCVCEIRRIAKQSVNTVDEYKRVIAICLLRWASFPSEGESPQDKEHDENRRVYAYWLANQLIAACCASSAVDVTTPSA